MALRVRGVTMRGLMRLTWSGRVASMMLQWWGRGLCSTTLRHRTNHKCDRGASKSIFYKVCSSLVNIETARNPDRGRSKSSFAKRVFVYKALRSLSLSLTRNRSSANLELYADYADRVLPNAGMISGLF